MLSDLARAWPTRPEPWLNLAALASRQGNSAVARAHLEAALQTSPAHAKAYELLQTLNAEMARQAYARALSQSPVTGNSTPLPWTLAAPDSQTAAATAIDPRASEPAPMPLPVATSNPAAPVQARQGPDVSLVVSTQAISTPRLPSTGWLAATALALLLGTAGMAAWARQSRAERTENTLAAPSPEPAAQDHSPEARLIDVYRLIGAARLGEALTAAQTLVRDAPTFRLAQLVYGDLLLAQAGNPSGTGQGFLTPDQPGTSQNTNALRREAQLRLQAMREPPPKGTWPRQVLALAPSVRHVVAVDTSRSRLYVLENQPTGPRLIAHHYVSIGSQGIGKREEGDQRTPLGVYYITSRLDRQQLGDFYGAGALPLSYPNEHDRRLHRTGANIWLHGTPSGQYARAPRATNGCIVLSNDDLARWLRELAPRSTPVIVAERLDWVAASALSGDRQTALALTESWRRARVHTDVDGLMALYGQHFDNGEQGYDAWRKQLQHEAQTTQGRERALEDLSVLAWHEQGEVLVVTFTEVLRGSTRGITRRQYWSRESGQWKIFSEGVLE